MGAPGTRASLTLDHAGLVGPNLWAMQRSFERLGFSPTESRPLLKHDAALGKSESLDQDSSHIVFDSGYLELSALRSANPAHHLARYAGRYAGLHILAMGCTDIEQVASRLRQSRIEFFEPQFAAREVAYGQRAGTARFKWLMLDPTVAPEALICVVQHLTPEIMFQPEVQSHPNTARALRGVTLVVDTPTRTAELLAMAAGATSRVGPDGIEVSLVGGSVTVCSETEFRRRFSGSSPPRLPCMAALAVEVASIEVATEQLVREAVPHCVSQEGIWIDGSHAAGAITELLIAG